MRAQSPRFKSSPDCGLGRRRSVALRCKSATAPLASSVWASLRHTAWVAAMGVEVRSLPSGFGALIRADGYLIFMEAAGRSVRALLSENADEEHADG
jgi:hypothetical protein